MDNKWIFENFRRVALNMKICISVHSVGTRVKTATSKPFWH
ncbi:hypothetical protein [uncultured Gammaproteobacteria bacterium]|nr:hypothetical protein [uncultured Gammaproteobacteria bacterium]CAC9556341.1 hypothetical protein [uncultured Gammaproteobacteria bacterium]CAC9566065.1 hypothetical protein [uncultured Gammaproteobacteria bacterium]CAC9591719.1 hypothetical protein [uncultured Gammaproteobacteria bacterium]CAC9962500.1 hypothetical protein [uncultured Gammaproteobacteria bacterium]